MRSKHTPEGLGHCGGLLIALLFGLICNAQISHGERAAQAALSYVGVKEHGCNNCGITVATFLRSTCIGEPASWCGAFQYYVQRECEYPMPGKNCQYAWVPSWFNKPKQIVWTYAKDGNNTDSIKVGDVASIYNFKKGREAHIGRIVAIDGLWVSMVEGNSNIYGSRDGDGVVLQRRPIDQLYRIARYQ